MGTLLGLNDDCLRHILSRLSVKDLVSVQRVNRRLCSLVTGYLERVVSIVVVKALGDYGASSARPSGSHVVQMLLSLPALQKISFAKWKWGPAGLSLEEHQYIKEGKVPLDDTAATFCALYYSQNLLWLDMTGHDLLPKDIRSLARNCTNLQMLDISSTAANDTTVDFVTSAWPRTLQHVVMNNCPRLSKAGIVMMIKRGLTCTCRNIRTITGNMKLELESERTHTCGRKGRIDLSGSVNLHSVELGSGVRVASINLSRCPMMIRASLDNPQLETVNLASCTKLENLLLPGSRLVSLNLFACHRLEVTNVVGQLEASRDSLERLIMNGLRCQTRLSMTFNNLAVCHIGGLTGHPTEIELHCPKIGELQLQGSLAGVPQGNIAISQWATVDKYESIPRFMAKCRLGRNLVFNAP